MLIAVHFAKQQSSARLRPGKVNYITFAKYGTPAIDNGWILLVRLAIIIFIRVAVSIAAAEIPD